MESSPDEPLTNSESQQSDLDLVMTNLLLKLNNSYTKRFWSLKFIDDKIENEYMK